MGLWEFLQQWRGGRAAAGVATSLLLHVLLVTAVLWGAKLPLAERWRVKPGDALIVELPKPEESPAPGVPDAPDTPPTPNGAPIAVKAPPPTSASSRPPVPAPPTPARREAPARQVAASTPRAPEPARSAPRPAEGARPAVARPAEPPAERGTDKAPGEPAPSDPAPRTESAPAAARAEGGMQVASVPPGGTPGGPVVPDFRSALRRGGGGLGQGRGGILGDPISLESDDPRFSDYLEKVRRQIQQKLTYPCVKDPVTFRCDPKDAKVVLTFGILKNGRVQFVEINLGSEWSIYDDNSTTAILLAQPFPPVPPAMMATRPVGSTGLPIRGYFGFTVYTSTIVR
jgi:hypothetical protein